MTLTVYCADCGTGCAVLYGREVDPGDRDIADAQVWACPVCSCAWAHVDRATGGSVGAPAGQATVNARAILRLDAVAPLIRQAPPNERAIAADRVAGFLAAQLGLTREAGAVDRLDLEQCRRAWRVLRAATYADVRAWAQNPPRRKARAA